ncbi:hypothetical protein EYF80_032198 [Liparis tanakae]|uniref:Uncharacterized protein n=1 Tax=Liparis tanakae TaxID=230148 RepID=A0A4Z2GVN9_9TELE|nr:hypothetical protein EYF80_032198 [Liparis tanakae]
MAHRRMMAVSKTNTEAELESHLIIERAKTMTQNIEIRNMSEAIKVKEEGTAYLVEATTETRKSSKALKERASICRRLPPRRLWITSQRSHAKLEMQDKENKDLIVAIKNTLEDKLKR